MRHSDKAFISGFDKSDDEVTLQGIAARPPPAASAKQPFFTDRLFWQAVHACLSTSAGENPIPAPEDHGSQGRVPKSPTRSQLSVQLVDQTRQVGAGSACSSRVGVKHRGFAEHDRHQRHPDANDANSVRTLGVLCLGSAWQFCLSIR